MCLKILVNGACGRLGSALCRLLEDGYRGHRLAAAVDCRAVAGSGVLRQLSQYGGRADALVDFSHHSATQEVCAFCEARGLPPVIATTGQTAAEKARIADAARRLPVFWAPNLSLGAALLEELARTAAALLPEADIEIVEAHHGGKLDAPSGTALALGATLAALRPDGRLVCGRCGDGPRRPGEIGIHALRLGERAGLHTVLLADSGQCLRLTHEAQSLHCYLQGAVLAAQFLQGQAPGLYGMPQLLAQRRAQSAALPPR